MLMFKVTEGVTPKVFRHKRIKDRRFLVVDGLIVSLDSVRHIVMRKHQTRRAETKEPTESAQVYLYYKHNTAIFFFDHDVPEAEAFFNMLSERVLVDFEIEELGSLAVPPA